MFENEDGTFLIYYIIFIQIEPILNIKVSFSPLKNDIIKFDDRNIPLSKFNGKLIYVEHD